MFLLIAIAVFCFNYVQFRITRNKLILKSLISQRCLFEYHFVMLHLKFFFCLCCFYAFSIILWVSILCLHTD